MDGTKKNEDHKKKTDQKRVNKKKVSKRVSKRIIAFGKQKTNNAYSKQHAR